MPEAESFDMTLDGEDVPQDFTPTFNIQDEVVWFQVSLRSVLLRTPILMPSKTSPEKEKPWYIVFQATTTRTSRDVLQFNAGVGLSPTIITCLVCSAAVSVEQKRKVQLAVTTSIAPNGNGIMKSVPHVTSRDGLLTIKHHQARVSFSNIHAGHC